MTFIETERLVLRRVEARDYPYFRDYLMDREMDRMMLRSPCRSEEDARLGFVPLFTEQFRFGEETVESVESILRNA